MGAGPLGGCAVLADSLCHRYRHGRGQVPSRALWVSWGHGTSGRAVGLECSVGHPPPPLSALYRGARSLSVEPLVPRTPEVYCPGPALTKPGSQGPASEVHLKLGVLALSLRGAPQGRQVRLGPVCHPFGVTPCARSVPKGPAPDSVLCCPPTSGRAVDVGELLTP